MISKELFSEVLSVNHIEILDVDDFLVDSDLFYTFKHKSTQKGHSSKINIYELSHRCKEWAVDKGYWIDTCLNEIKIGSGTLIDFNHNNIFEDHLEDTEPEVVFYFCQWILNETK